MKETARGRKPALVGSPSTQRTLITGGAGFIGANLAHRLISQGRPVLIFDNLSRPGVEQNIDWLRETHGRAFDLVVEDVRDRSAVARAVARASQVFHFAAQVAVTTSIADPLEDFSVNAQGTLNVLEAARAQPVPPPIVMTSTNKVYGALDDIALDCLDNRYSPSALGLRRRGVSETRRLDFHSPYGCSKGTADQYVIDSARTYGLATVVFRMSCIYGPHQFGTEDQGWVAHFIVRALAGEPITVYGDGRQVRDILFVEDLVNAFVLAEQHVQKLSGCAFNIGGGAHNAISLLDLLDHIETLHGERPAVSFQSWRTADQRYYVSDTASFERATGWKPTVGVKDGLERLYRWLRKERSSTAASTHRSTSAREPIRAAQPLSRIEEAR
jgi:CDP-paratose 2-epimerase